MPVAGRRQEQLGGVGGAAGDDHDVGRVDLALALAVDLHGGDRGAGRVGAQPPCGGAGEQGDVRVLQGRPDAVDLGVGLGVQRAGEPVAEAAADAAAVGQVALVEHHPAGGVERVVAARRQVVGELLDPGLVGERREGVRGAGRGLGGVLPAGAVHLVVLLGLRVVRLHVVVGDRPRRRDAVVVLQLAEVLAAQAVEGGAVELGGAADEVVDLRLERLAVLVVPGVGGDVAAVDEHVLGRPVLGFAGQPATPLEQQDALARRGEVPGQRAAAGTGADDDDVVVVGAHVSSATRSIRTIRAAASMSARWENAWGKFPRWWAVSVSNSSA